jgi:hypothetical protein
LDACCLFVLVGKFPPLPAVFKYDDCGALAADISALTACDVALVICVSSLS